MSAAELERYLHEHIPLSKAMGVSVNSVESTRVVLCAPLGPNINHRETAFGGSISALAILSAWSLLRNGLLAEGLSARLVIQRNTMEYLRPITGELVAIATLESSFMWQRFLRTFNLKGKARITVSSVLQHADVTAGNFTGEFVALGTRDA